MTRLLVPFGVISLLSAPALAAPPYAVGTAVVDTKGASVGTIAATEGDTIVTVRTDKHDIRLPVSSFAKDPNTGKLLLALSQAELNAKFEADQAAVAASLEVGKPVKGLNGQVLGTIEAIDDKEVQMKLPTGQTVKFPRSGIAGASDGAVVGITAEQLEAQIKGTSPAS